MRGLNEVERRLIIESIHSITKPGPARDLAMHRALLGPKVMSRREFIELALPIPDKKTGVWGKHKCNRVQRQVEAVRLRTQRANLPERYATLKARKWGMSTHWLRYGVEFATRTEQVQACIIADETSKANALLEIGKLMCGGMPFHLPMKYSNRKVMYWDQPLSSMIDIESADKEDPCRGRTYRFIHATEPQLWDKTEKKAIAIENAVPDEPGTVISYEGTGAGINWWHDFWWKARNEDSIWHAFFFPWWYDKDFDYCLPILAGDSEAILATLDDEEKELLRQGMDVGQLKWRRAKLRDTFRGNLDLLHQEFPSTPREAFLASGRPCFVGSQVLRVKARAREPIWRGDIHVTVENDVLTYKLSANPKGVLKLWSTPKPYNAYVMASDCGHGVRGGDPSACIVLDAVSCEQVATLYCSPEKPDYCIVPAKEFGRFCVALGMHFNTAYYMPEIEGPGIAALSAARELQYGGLGRRESFDKTGRTTIEKHGWSTNINSRPRLFAEIREHLAAGEEGAQFHDHRLAEEMLGMVFDDSMREDHQSSGHDDLVIAWGICLIARRIASGRGLIEAKAAEKPLTADEQHWADYHALVSEGPQEENEEYVGWDQDW